MAYKLKHNYSKRGNYGSKRSTSDINYCVIHWTGLDGDTDEANAEYFHNNLVEASAHAFVDDDSVTISVPANYVAWSVGSQGLLDQASPYASKGAKFWGRANNSNTYNIEICDTIRDGIHMCSDKTWNNAVKYTAKIMKKYHISLSNLIRHFDVNGKVCPIYMVVNENLWKKFKQEVGELLGETTEKKRYEGTYPTLPSRGYFKLGSYGKQVKYLQMFLNWAINSKLEVDGQYGIMTEKAVKNFQKKYGLEADGLFGKMSLAMAKTITK